MTYEPPTELLDRYAALLVNFALGNGRGITAGDTVQISTFESAKPLVAALGRAVWKAGGHVLLQYRPDDDATINMTRDRFACASDEELDFYPAAWHRALWDATDHVVFISTSKDPRADDGLDPAKLMRRQRASSPSLKWRLDKEAEGRLTWLIAIYGTAGMAAEADLSLEQYWEQIIQGCMLDDPDPIARWREINATLTATKEWLTGLDIDRVHVEGPDADLWITIGEGRRWEAGGGSNIPSFEVFTFPDWRGTEGWIRFTEPVYLHGPKISGVEFTFENGIVTRATASENEPLLKDLVATDANSDKLAEFSLTDGRVSPITKFMANTLFDENVGGRYGNTHIALGLSVPHMVYSGDASTLTPEAIERLGFNSSGVHTDFVSRTDRTVTATLRDGSETVIYTDGKFTR